MNEQQRKYNLREESKIWDILDNTFLSTVIILVIGLILAVCFFRFASGISFLVMQISVALAVGWALLGVYARNGTTNSYLALITSWMSLYLLVSNFTHVFFEPVSTKKIADSIVSVAGGFLNDSYYMTIPELLEVNQRATEIADPFIIRSQTNDGMFEKVFICVENKISSDCGASI